MVLASLLCQRASCLPHWLLNQEVQSWHLHLSKASTSIKAQADALYLVNLMTAHLSSINRELTTHQAMTTSFTTIVSLNDFLLFWNTFIFAVIIHFESLIASPDVLTLLPHLMVDWEHKSFSVSFVLSLFKVMSNRQLISTTLLSSMIIHWVNYELLQAQYTLPLGLEVFGLGNICIYVMHGEKGQV